MACSTTQTKAYIVALGCLHIFCNIVAMVFFIQPLLLPAHEEKVVNGHLITIDRHNPTISKVAISIAVTACSLAIMFSLLMITGVFMKNHKFMAPYVHFGFIGFIASGILCTVAIMVFIYHLEFEKLCDFTLRCILIEGIQFVVWYPVYKEWQRQTRAAPNSEVQQKPGELKDEKLLNAALPF